MPVFITTEEFRAGVAAARRERERWFQDWFERTQGEFGVPARPMSLDKYSHVNTAGVLVENKEVTRRVDLSDFHPIAEVLARR